MRGCEVRRHCGPLPVPRTPGRAFAMERMESSGLRTPRGSAVHGLRLARIRSNIAATPVSCPAGIPASASWDPCCRMPRIDGREQRPVEFSQKPFCSIESPVQADGPYQRFERIRKDGWPAEPAALELSFAESQVIAERQRNCQLRKRLLVDQPGAQDGTDLPSGNAVNCWNRSGRRRNSAIRRREISRRSLCGTPWLRCVSAAEAALRC